MKKGIRHRRELRRVAYFSEQFARFSAERRALDFAHDRPMVSIIGDFVSDRIRSDGIYERDILEFLRDRLLDLEISKIQVAIDVGANIGNHSLFLSDLFATVIAFEPNPLARSILDINLQMNGASNVEVRAVGLSDRAGKATLAFDQGNLGGASVLGIRSGSGGRSEIELTAGDEVLDPSTPVGLIKVDVEGLEESVLRGLERTIRLHQPIVMIEQWADVIDGSSGTSPSFNFLRGLGYSAWELAPGWAFRGIPGKITSLLLGRADYRFNKIELLEKREYSTLFFLPPRV
jgi:FkbM family methyltransferase